MGNHKFLFGTSFYKALNKRVKGNKHSVEIKRQLGGKGNFVDTYFCDKYVGDTALKETVLKDQPKPNHKGLQALILDPDMVHLLPRQAQHPARSIGTSFRWIQGRMLDTMGSYGANLKI